MLTLVEKRAPQRADEICRQGGNAFRQADNTDRSAFALGISPRRVRQLRDGDKTSAISRFFTLLASIAMVGGSPFPLVATAQSIALQSLINGMTDEQLVARFWMLVEKEATREGIENTRSSLFAHDGNLEAFADAHEGEASVSLELAAVARELSRRGVNPRTLMLG